MKKFFLFFVVVILVSSVNARKLENDQYRRNSLYPFFITDFGKLDRNVMSNVDFACQNYKVPLKYDSHDLNIDRTIQVRNIELKGKFKPKQGFFQKEWEKLKSDVSQKSLETLERHEMYVRMPKKLAQFLDDNKIANRLIAKWFNASNVMTDGSFYNMNLIQERGIYSASELEKLRANESVRGRAILQDAGLELLSHTYVSFTYFDYETSQDRNERGKENSAKIFGTSSPLGKAFQESFENNIKNVSGYKVKATTYLFKLKWDSNTEDIFIEKYYNKPVSELLNSNDFEMEYVGHQKGPSILYEEYTGKGALGNSMVAGEATIRAIDASLGYLQREFEDFRVKAPLIDVNDSEITAFIGTKEGVTKKSSFEVLERVYNERKNRYEYKKVSSIKVDKNHPIFKNDYVFGQEEEPVGKTYFKGSASELAPGMLIRQTK